MNKYNYSRLNFTFIHLIVMNEAPQIPAPIKLERQETVSVVMNSLNPKATITSYKGEMVGTHDEKEARRKYRKRIVKE